MNHDTSRSRIAFLACALVATTACAVPAAGAVISYTQTLDEVLLVEAPPNASDVLTQVSLPFPRLDPSVGTLNSVNIEYQLDCRLDVAVVSSGGGSAGVGVTIYADDNAFWGSGDGRTVPSQGPGTATVLFPVASARELTLTGHPPAFSTFIGTGDVTVRLDMNSGATASGDASVDLFLLDTSFVRVTYDYDAVPEPAILGPLAMCGLLPLLRRRRALAAPALS